VRSLWRDAAFGVRARRRRAALSGLGVALATAMLATSAIVGFGLATGFARGASAAGMADVIARFDPQPLDRIAPRIAALPDVAAVSFRYEATGVRLGAVGHSADNGVVDVLGPGRRGYALLAGRDLSGQPDEALVEQGLAHAWGLRPGSTLLIAGLGYERVVGVVESPDDVAYPLAAPRVYISRAGLEARVHARLAPTVNMVEIWARDQGALGALLVQARENAYGIHDLRFVTRAGVRVLIDQAAGIVIALLVALSVVALVTAGVMLAASARAEVQRRLNAIGVLRAVGASRRRVAGLAAAEAALVAAPAAGVGVLAGLLVAVGPSDALLGLLNEPPPGAALALPLAACALVAIGIPVAVSAWPAWRAARRPPVALLRGAELAAGARPQRVAAGLAGLGARLVAARRTRLLATLTVLGISAAFILLMLALAAQLSALENDPAALGRRYQLVAPLPAADAARVAALPGVAAASPRYEITAADSFDLGETIDVIAYPGDHTAFEAPPLASGSRLSGDREAEVGVGLAQVLGLSPGSTLALALPSGVEARFRVSGTVDSLDHDGRVAYVPAASLLAADPGAPEQIAIRLRPGASAGTVSNELRALGVSPSRAPTVSGRSQTLIGALTAILRAVAAVDGFVCLYTLIQALALVAAERRETIAVLRACGAGRAAVTRLLAGAAAVVVVPAAAIAVVLERLVLGPALTRIAAGYVTLALGAGAELAAGVVLGLLALAAAAVCWVSRQAARESIVAGLPA
jgi:ABC-type antimicrobial peptide transport system permease subunit